MWQELYRRREGMGPKRPEARNLTRKELELVPEPVDDTACTLIRSQERRRILTSERIRRVVAQCLREETTVQIYKDCFER